jgi:predicted ester cyclase
VTANTSCEHAKAVVRRNTEEVLGKGDFKIFDLLFAEDFLDHSPPPGFRPDKNGVRELYKMLRTAFPDFRAEIHWQLTDGDCVTTYKTYHGTHRGDFLGVEPTGREVHFEALDVIRVRTGKLAEHWGVANLLSLMQQLGPPQPARSHHSQGKVSLWVTNTPWQVV